MSSNKSYPKWAEQAVWYQIFPERFCRANTQNPISAAHLEGTTPFSLDRSNAWKLHDWTSDWYLLDECEKQNDADLKTHILRRRYGGDVNGIIQRLGYLKELGINALYITPLQYSPSLHKYDGTNFLHTDPFFGSDPLNDIRRIEEEDFDDFENAAWTTADLETLELIEQAHAHGMRIIFDGVFNHIGYNSKPFQDVLQHREKSKYASWFYVDFAKSTAKKLNYQQFWGCVREMPKLNYSSDEVKRYVFATLKRWLCPVVNGKKRQGIDGWRIDHAIGVPVSFWKEAHKYVKKLKKDSLFLGELIEPEEIIKPYLNQGVFDSVMNYGLLEEMCKFFAAESNCSTASQFDNGLKHLLSLYPTECNFLMQNLLGTHDTERIASYIVNRRLKKFGGPSKIFINSHASDHNYNTRKPLERERKIQKMMILFQFAFVGAPMVYYGDEAGMWGANDPDCRKPMMWSDIQFDGELPVRNGIRGSHPNVVKFSKDMFAYYQKVISLRKNHPALCNGTFETLYSSENERIYAFERANSDERLVFVFNREQQPRTISLPSAKTVSDYFTGEQYFPDSDGMIQAEVKPFGTLVLL